MAFPILRLLTASLCCSAAAAFSAPNSCVASTGGSVTPVLELYTSEGCSSCPPADRWLSSLKSRPSAGTAVIQAFHVGYWDYIGWVDRFADPAHTARQRQIAGWNRQRSIYTPQTVLNGKDWRDWYSTAGRLPEQREAAHMAITLRQLDSERFEATVTSDDSAPSSWSAYWTVTEHGHSSKVKAGENAGEQLHHDYVVRQYTPAGDYQRSSTSPQRLSLRTIAASAGHDRQINLVIFDPRTGRTVQAISVGC